MKFIGINVKLGDITKRMVIAFPEDLIHANVAQWMGRACREQWPEAKVTTTSAGSIDARAEATYHFSESLNLKPRPDDVRCFNLSDYGGNVDGSGEAVEKIIARATRISNLGERS